MENPTLSPQSNQLLEMCLGMLEGKNTPDELWALIGDVYIGLEKARNDFIEQVSKQGEEYLEKMQIEMDMVLTGFENYQAGLDHITEFFQTKRSQNISEGMDMIIRATNEILDTLTVYEAKSLQVGPTSFPILNMLIILVDGFKEGTVPEDEFRFMIFNTGQFFQKLVEEAEGYKGEEGRDAIEMLKEGYNRFIDGLEMMDEAAQGKNDMLMDDALNIIRESQEIIKNGYIKFNDDLFTKGPTESPVTNLLISTIRSVREGTVPKELLDENLNSYQEHLDSMRADMENAAAMPLDNEEIQSELANTIAALDVAEEGCEFIHTYLQTGNMVLLESAVERLKESTVLLKKSKEVFDDIGEREGKIACVRCGSLNEPANNTCSKCKAMLTKIPGTHESSFTMGETGEMTGSMHMGEEEEFVMTENLVKLFDAIERYVTNQSDFAELTITLDWMEDLLNGSLEELKQIQKTKKDMFNEETIDLFHDGVDEFFDAINSLRALEDEPDHMREHLRAGIEGIVSASKKLEKVQRIAAMAENKSSQSEFEPITETKGKSKLIKVAEDSDEEIEDNEDEEEHYGEEQSSDEEDEDDDSFTPSSGSFTP